MWVHVGISTRRRRPADALNSLLQHPHLSRLAAGLVALGVTDLAHHLLGADVDWLLLVIGAAGVLWSAFAKRTTSMLAGIVLAAVGLFAVLDDHDAFTRVEDALILLLMAGLILLTPGLPVSWRSRWPIVPAGALVLVALMALLQLAATQASLPWSVGAPILVVVLGAALLLWDARGGTIP